MKSFYTLFVLCLCLFVSSCSKDETPPETCQLYTIDRGNGNVHNYIYGTDNKIKSMTRAFDGNGSGKTSNYVYTFTYDAAGLIIKSVWTLDSKPDGSETYTYTNGKISKVNYTYADGSKGFNQIKYDTKGNMLEFSFETGDPASDSKQFFVYDANDIMIKRGFSDLSGKDVYAEFRTTVVGLTKSPESTLANVGLPYDVLLGLPWAANIGGVGSKIEPYFQDSTGKLVIDNDGTIKYSKILTNGQNFVTELTYSNLAGVVIDKPEKYTIYGCK
jgi:hypothetical protein